MSCWCFLSCNLSTSAVNAILSSSNCLKVAWQVDFWVVSSLTWALVSSSFLMSKLTLSSWVAVVTILSKAINWALFSVIDLFNPSRIDWLLERANLIRSISPSKLKISLETDAISTFKFVNLLAYSSRFKRICENWLLFSSKVEVGLSSKFSVLLILLTSFVIASIIWLVLAISPVNELLSSSKVSEIELYFSYLSVSAARLSSTSLNSLLFCLITSLTAASLLDNTLTVLRVSSLSDCNFCRFLIEVSISVSRDSRFATCAFLLPPVILPCGLITSPSNVTIRKL